MSYTAPSVDASSVAFADLQKDGFAGHVAALVAAQSPAMSATAVTLTDQLLTTNQASLPFKRASQIVASFLHGDPVDVTSLKTEIFDLQYAYAAIAAVLGEIGVLVDANQGSLAFKPNQITGKTTRVFS